MGLFISRAAKMTVDKSKMATSYFLTGACFFLIACNAGLFIFLPNLLAPLAIILSNTITVILMLIALRPINHLLQHEFEKKAEELVARHQEEIALRERVSELETANQELERKIDSWAQTAGVPANLNLSFKVETMTYDKSGYIVKEEPLERFLEDPAYGLTGKNGLMDRFEKWLDSVSHPGERKVLYIGKYYIKASIGLDFTCLSASGSRRRGRRLGSCCPVPEFRTPSGLRNSALLQRRQVRPSPSSSRDSRVPPAQPYPDRGR